jgi:hypothetical protein
MGLRSAWKKTKRAARDTVTRNNPIAGTVRAGLDVAHGDFGKAFKDTAAGMTWGLSNPIASGVGKIGDVMYDAFAGPSNQIADANREAGKAIGAAADQAGSMSDAGTNRALDQTTPWARQYEQKYGQGGALSGPTDSKQLYDNMSQGGMSPYWQNQLKTGTQGLNDAFAARGLQNSGAALKASEKLGADVLAGSSRDMMGLAQQSDSTQEARQGGAVDRLLQGGQVRANTVQHGTDRGIDAFTAGAVGKANANLAATQASAQGDANIIGGLTQLGGAVIGGVVGGPTGAAAGYQAGSAVAPKPAPKTRAPVDSDDVFRPY